MKRKTVNNLVISGVAFLGLSYVIGKCVKNIKKDRLIQNSKEMELEEDKTSINYYPIGKIVEKDGKFTVKKIGK